MMRGIYFLLQKEQGGMQTKVKRSYIVIAILMALLVVTWLFFWVQRKKREEFEEIIGRYRFLTGVVEVHFEFYIESASLMASEKVVPLPTKFKVGSYEPSKVVAATFVIESKGELGIGQGFNSSVVVVNSKNLSFNENSKVFDIVLCVIGPGEITLRPVRMWANKSGWLLEFNLAELFQESYGVNYMDIGTRDGLFRANAIFRQHDKKGYLVLPKGIVKGVDSDIRLDLTFGVRVREVFY
jgi:hypothetical protein